MANRRKSKKNKSKTISTQQTTPVTRSVSAPKTSVKEQLQEKKKLLNPTVLIALLTTFLLTQTPLMIKSYVDKRGTYAQAEAMFEAENYEAAIALWANLGEYLDCAERIADAEDAKLDLIYQDAVSLLNEAKYEDAKHIFLSIPDYKDALKQADLCVTLDQEMTYAHAVSALDACDYETAISLLDSLGSYEDSEALLCEAAYRYACDLRGLKLHADSIHYFAMAGSYEDAAEKLNAARYSYGNQLNKRKDYKGAVEQYEKCSEIEGLDETIDAAKHAYIDSHFDAADSVTKQYLDELSAKGDKTAKKKAQKLYL